MSSAGWKDIKYRQDLPPPGGYGSIPYKRNLPVRGPTAAVMIGLAFAIHGIAYYNHQLRVKYTLDTLVESQQADHCFTALLDAEKDRALLRIYKENVESEALNIVGTGYDPDYLPGLGTVYHSKRFVEPDFTGGRTNLFYHVKLWYERVVGIPRCGP